MGEEAKIEKFKEMCKAIGGNVEDLGDKLVCYTDVNGQKVVEMIYVKRKFILK